MRRLALVLLAAASLAAVAPPPPQTFYQSMYVVSGTSPERRTIGFREALRRLMVKISGDRRLADDPTVAKMIEHAADYVVDFSYLDLKFGVPIHDEQGTRDRAQYLTVTFDQARIDAALKRLHRKIWTDRPRLVVFVTVHLDPQPPHLLDATSKRDETMRASLADVLRLYGIPVAFPTLEAVAKFNPADPATASVGGGDLPLVGTLNWSDAELGWVADWGVIRDGEPVRWQKRGINFDEAFREGVSGAALILSGNGTP